MSVGCELCFRRKLSFCLYLLPARLCYRESGALSLSARAVPKSNDPVNQFYGQQDVDPLKVITSSCSITKTINAGRKGYENYTVGCAQPWCVSVFVAFEGKLRVRTDCEFPGANHSSYRRKKCRHAAGKRPSA